MMRWSSVWPLRETMSWRSMWTMAALQKNFPDYLPGDSIKWNFTKFLVDRAGKVRKRYSPSVRPERIAKEIAKLLEEAH